VQAAVVHATGPLAGVRLQDVASQVGLDFRQGAFRFGVSNDLAAMMGGGVCWLDYDHDGWLDLFVGQLVLRFGSRPLGEARWTAPQRALRTT